MEHEQYLGTFRLKRGQKLEDWRVFAIFVHEMLLNP